MPHNIWNTLLIREQNKIEALLSIKDKIDQELNSLQIKISDLEIYIKENIDRIYDNDNKANFSNIKNQMDMISKLSNAKTQLTNLYDEIIHKKQNLSTLIKKQKIECYRFEKMGDLVNKEKLLKDERKYSDEIEELVVARYNTKGRNNM
jgi:hypothetical protein